MNYVLDQLEQLMVSVQQHEISFIVFAVMALFYLGANLCIICCVHKNPHSLRELEKRLTEGYNKIAESLLTKDYADLLPGNWAAENATNPKWHNPTSH